MSPSPTARPRLNLVLVVLTVLAVGALLYALLSPHSGRDDADGRGDRVAGTAAGPVATPEGGAAEAADTPESVPIPDNHSMTLDIPALARADDVRVESAPESATAPLRHGALHIRGTGLPWQRGGNVYLAAHRLGFPGTKSYRLFWDLPKLEKGDPVVLTDNAGTRYEYRVFREIEVGPRDVHVADPVPGKSVVSLQTCTLPDYTERIVVQAELTEVLPRHARAPSRETERG